MSEFFLVKCNEPHILSLLSTSVASEIRALAPHLEVKEFRKPGILILVAVNPCTPLGTAESPEGSLALVMGNQPGKTAQETAVKFLVDCTGNADDAASALCHEMDYGAAAAVLESGDVVLTADYLGLFSLFVHSRPDLELAVCASALRLVRFVPGFQAKPDLAGVVSGLLLGHHLFGHTAWADVKRLAAHSILRLGPGGRAEEYVLPLPDPPPCDHDFNHHVEVTHSILTELMSAHGRTGLRAALLSGGLDSRMVAGYLGEHRGGSPVKAYTVGADTDSDVQFALKVMRELQFSPNVIRTASSQYAGWAESEVALDATESSMYMMFFWCVVRGLADSPSPVACGLLADAVLGVSHVRWGYDRWHDDYSFDTVFKNNHECGLPPRVIRRLIKDDSVGDIVEQQVKALRAVFEAYPGEPWRRVWWFTLHHHMRFMVGRVAKVMAMTSWPVMPLIHYRVIELTASLPLSTLLLRRLQREVVIRKFPRLAALPLDRNSSDTRSLNAGQKQPRLPWAVRESWKILSQSLKNKLGAADNRFYFREYDLNAPGWKEVCTLARRRLEATSVLIDTNEAAKLIPDGEHHLEMENIFRQGAGRKALMSLILWLAEWDSSGLRDAQSQAAPNFKLMEQ